MNFNFKYFAIFWLQVVFVSAVYGQYNYKTYLAKAQMEIEKKNYSEAIVNLNICILAQPENCEVYYYRGACKYSLSDNIGAEQDLTKALMVFSSVYYDAYRYRSLVRYQLGKFSEAIDDINKVIDKQQNNPVYYIERAFYYLASNNFNAAITDCNKAISLKSFGEDVYFCKAIAEDALTNYEDAVCDFDLLHKNNPRNGDAFVRRGMTKFKMGYFNDAIDDYNRALMLDSINTFAIYNRAEAEIKLNEKDKALKDYDTVLFFEPRNAYAYFNRAVLYAGQEKFKAAIEDFNKVLFLNPNNIQALFNRAKLKQNIDDYKGAIADYNKIIELYPYFMEAYYFRSQMKSRIKDYAGAKKDIETGKMMSSIYHNKSKSQINLDSVLLNKLTYLSADFYKSSDLKSDTFNIAFLPVFYFSVNDSSHAVSRYFSNYLDNYNSRYKLNITLKNNLNELNDTANMYTASLIKEKDVSLTAAIQKSNLQLFNEATEIFNKIISEDTMNALAYFARGVNTCREIDMMKKTDEPYFLTSSKQGIFENERHTKCQSAHADFARTLKLVPDFSFAYYNLGYVKCLLGDFDGALYDYEQAIKINHDFAEAYYNYAFVLYYTKHKQDACLNFSRAGELGLNSAFIFIKKYCKGFDK